MAIFPGSAIPSAGGVYTYSIDQSLRFEDGSSAYLNRVFSDTPTTWTFSCWVKRGNIGVQQEIAASRFSGGNASYIEFTSNDTLQVGLNSSGSVLTTAKFRDPSAWYHIVVAVTPSSTSYVYVNGAEVATWTATSNSYLFRSPSYVSTIGRYGDYSGYYFDGYMAEVNFIDGSALGPEYFGETDDTWGIWKPKAYSGSYGTNGFYLDFSNGAAIGEDSSGNSNDWTANNLAATDIMLDSPTNNWCTLNPLQAGSNVTLSEGNLSASTPSWSSVGCSFAYENGGYYFEAYLSSSLFQVGVIDQNILTSRLNTYPESSGANWTVQSNNGYLYYGTSSSVNIGATFSSGDIIQIAHNATTGDIYVGKNGTWLNSGSPIISNATGYNFTPVVAPHAGTTIANFGQDSSFAGNKTAQNNTDANGYGDFYYPVPSGFLALCSANLTEAAVVPGENFNTVLYSGDGTSNRSITTGLQSDFVWIKRRNSATAHILFDVIRGAGKTLYSHLNYAEQDNGAYYVQSFDSDGFTLGTGGDAADNETGGTYVSWSWKADGTTGSSNTDGSITSTVAANPDAGFSIIGYTGTGATATVGHGLSQAPEFVIYKRRDSTSSWLILTDIIDGSMDYGYLNSSSAFGGAAQTAPTSSVLNLYASQADSNISGATHIAYCFHSVDGYSKFGRYTGNGSADGTFVYTGFRPAFVLVKQHTASGEDWYIHDGKRNPYNPTDTIISANTTGGDVSSYPFDFVANGFKIRTSNSAWNASGQGYIFMAFAESPFNYSTAR